MYVKKHQQRPHEWALNGHGTSFSLRVTSSVCSNIFLKKLLKKTLNLDVDGDKLQKRFWKFMEEMGHKIDLTTWTGYRGDMGKKGTTYYDHWDPEDGMGKVDGV